MSVQTFDIADALTITPAAAAHFADQVAKKNASAIRISLKESGCTGYMYVIEEVQGPEENDLTIHLDNGVDVFVDPQNVGKLQGTIVDYRKSGLNKNLVMENPNVKHACGCGESFSF